MMMLEEWASLDKWCSPLMLLLSLNLMILTILFASRSGNENGKKLRRLKDMSQLVGFNYNNATQQEHHHMIDDDQKKTHAAEGAVNERLLMSSSKSAFRSFREAELAAFELQPIIETETETERSMDEVYSQLLQSQGSHMNRTKSDTEPASGVVLIKLANKMKKSASSKSAFKHFKEAEIVEAQRPATMKEVKEAEYVNEDDEEVDSKADDFINMFKQQLKLQRLDSIISYKEMLDRGASR